MKTEIIKKIQDLQIEKIAQASKFYVRQSRKITATNFVTTFFMMMRTGKFSLKGWAFNIFEKTNTLVSHQGVAKKLGFSNVNFAKTLFESALLNSLNHSSNLQIKPHLKAFKRILIEDSTCFKLPKNLFQFFPGSSNQAKGNSCGKIQLCIDLFSNLYSHIQLASYRDTDVKYAPTIFEYLNKGDLILRDLGYWKIDILTSIHEKGAYFISRLKVNTSLCLPFEKADFNLYDYLKSKEKCGITKVDHFIIIESSNEKFRMVAMKLTEDQAKKRRAKAKRRRNRKTKTSNVSKKTLYLMSWNIFITNVEKDVLNTDQIYSTYNLRWHIEIIFKNWKSNFKLMNFVKTSTGYNPARIEIIIMFYLTWIVLVYKPTFNVYQNLIYKKTNKILSPAKYAQFLKKNYNFLTEQTSDTIVKALTYYCCFDKRNDRKNYVQKLNMIMLS